MSDVQYLSVTALTKYLKRKFDADPYLERVYLTAEISNFRNRPNSHQYFSLKDEKAKISAVMFKQAFAKLKFKPEEGMKVLVIGRVSLYEASGSYQIYVEHMEPAGVGALYQAYEELKKKLTQEGVFKVEHKQPLVKYPKRIAVITSPSGAVIRDIITTIQRRYPITQLVLFPTLVQGDKASVDIVRQIQRVNQQGDFDTLIVARGGGSIEDLWPFNEENVARAIFESRTPVISSVGHETDTTIADLVADVRAATPTAAAEIATPVLTEEMIRLKEQEAKIHRILEFKLKHEKQRLLHLQSSVLFKQPQRLYEPYSLKMDELTRRLIQTTEQQVRENDKKYQALNQRLHLINVKEKISNYQIELQHNQEKLLRSIHYLFESKRNLFEKNVESLDMLSPLKTMTRGYSYVTLEGEIIKDTSKLKVEQNVKVTLSEGSFNATVNEIVEKED